MKLSAITKKIIVATMIFSTILVPSAVLSQNSPEYDPVAIYKEAGINAEQESNIRKIADEYDKENIQRLQNLAQMLHELKSMAYQPVLNESALLAKQDEINKLQSEIAIQRIKLVIKIRGLLTNEQNTKLAAILENRAKAEAQAH